MALSADSPERGSMILFLFIAIALFGALSYAFTHGSRNSVSMLQGVQSDAAGTATQDCTNTVNLAVKRLELRGCGSKISYLADGSNANTDAPTDGSCSVFHPNGGGAKACNASAITGPAAFDLTTLLPGEAGGGVVYVGMSGGKRIYTTPNDGIVIRWDNGLSANIITGANDDQNGLANTNILVGLSNAASPYAAAVACRALGPEWYLPSRNELVLLKDSRNIGALSGTFSQRYWASTEYNGVNAYFQFMGPILFGPGNTFKSMSGALKARCVRSD